MNKSVLIIDDEKHQAIGLAKALKKELNQIDFFSVYEQNDIKTSIIEKFYSLAIVDIRMDSFDFDGIALINDIIEKNPFAKILIVSAFTNEYLAQTKKLLLSGKIVDIVEKEELDIWIPKLKQIIESYFIELEDNPSQLNKALLDFYSESKNTDDTYIKGEKFEQFVSLLFGSIGFKDIKHRVIDKSLNEVDLIIRNEIDDKFLNKLGNYFLVECKNKPNTKVDKNDFIVFASKLKSTNGLANIGFLFTSNFITRNTYLEALRTSNDTKKVIFFSNPEIERLLKSNDIKEEFKKIIDEQVKDN
jgi:CheY-like chemotaxis protein